MLAWNDLQGKPSMVKYIYEIVKETPEEQLAGHMTRCVQWTPLAKEQEQLQFTSIF